MNYKGVIEDNNSFHSLSDNLAETTGKHTMISTIDIFHQQFQSFITSLDFLNKLGDTPATRSAWKPRLGQRSGPSTLMFHVTYTTKLETI